MFACRSLQSAAACLVLLLGSCAQPRLEQPVEARKAAPLDFPERFYRQAAEQGKPVYRVDPANSLVVIEVRRAGSLARLGHDHVVASHDVAGYIAPGEGRADVYVPLLRLAVDESALRTQSGFETQPSQEDIEGTRANMLGKVLEAERFPFARISVSGVAAGAGDTRMRVAITLHGVTRTPALPLQLATGDNQITVTGRFVVDQTDFGITPYAILGGAIAVRNDVELRFQIRAARVGSLD